MTRARWPFVLLLGFLLIVAGVITWDYIEVWRLDRELARIAALGEPTTTRGLDTTPTGEEETAASRYYRAAVALVNRESRPGQNLFQVQLGQARRSNQWPDDLVSQMRQRVSANEDALLYIDRAAALDFHGFREYPPISSYQLDNLLPVAELRTNLLAIEGRGDEAALSLYSALRAQRTGLWSLDGPAAAGKTNARRAEPFASESLTRQLQMLVERTQPSAKHLALLADAFAALDDDDLLLHNLLWLRAASRINVDNPTWWLRGAGSNVTAFRLGQSVATSIQAPLYRPFLLHQMNRWLRDYGEAIASQAGKGWPDRLNAHAAFDRRPGLQGHAHSVAREIVVLRSARTIIAIEQYQRTNAERMPENWNALAQFQAPLIDPFSGQPLKILPGDDGYVVYSVGPNRRDDNGNIDFQVTHPGQRSIQPIDIGMRVQRSSPIPNP